MRDCKKVFWSAKDFCNAKGLVSLCLEIGMVNTPQAWTLAAAGASRVDNTRVDMTRVNALSRIKNVFKTTKTTTREAYRSVRFL